ncbi:hypothetical protein NEOLI_002695 [Neolecta irregularis DAH-3]|uniref:Uncharacterized protein n=1 Tax=Neolecta irregularis (strain DAH-3) TaxID=1198029 RepID=A0A1U7LMH1_NEOID|nr:hypothetical protein NEOLI_002695 [Neolecta irregularis DAH-3]|eukprot:OLL23854.1 hypothetical protein NEOLI_002695 [Neolecta irregularis DAH-3]
MVQLMARKLELATFSKAALEAYRFTGPDGIERGFLDQLGKDPEEVLKIALSIGKDKAKFGQSAGYGKMKREVWRNIVQCLKEDGIEREKILSKEMEAEEKRMESIQSKL